MKKKIFEAIVACAIVALAVMVAVYWNILYPNLWHIIHKGKTRFNNAVICVPKGWIPLVRKDKLTIAKYPNAESGITFSYGRTPKHIMKTKAKSIFESRGEVLDDLVELTVGGEEAISAIGHPASKKEILIEYTSVPSQLLIINFQGNKNDQSIYRQVLYKLTFVKTEKGGRFQKP